MLINLIYCVLLICLVFFILQASIEEEDEERTLCSTSGTPKIEGAAVDRPSSTSSSSSATRRSITPDYFVCTTKEQLQNHINMRAQSPELRHVPIIKLPDQMSDEV